MAVGACQGFCGLHQAAQCFPFPEALGSLAWPQHTVFMSCVIADLSLSRRPASVKIGSCSLRARPEPHHLQQSDHISHHPLPDGVRGPQARWQNQENKKVFHFDPCNYLLCTPKAVVKNTCARACTHTHTVHAQISKHIISHSQPLKQPWEPTLGLRRQLWNGALSENCWQVWWKQHKRGPH